jgi:hypothetical protein
MGRRLAAPLHLTRWLAEFENGARSRDNIKPRLFKRRVERTLRSQICLPVSKKFDSCLRREWRATRLTTGEIRVQQTYGVDDVEIPGWIKAQPRYTTASAVWVMRLILQVVALNSSRNGSVSAFGGLRSPATNTVRLTNSVLQGASRAGVCVSGSLRLRDESIRATF